MIRGAAYLHELHRIMGKAALDQRGQFHKRDTFRKKTLLPKTKIAADNTAGGFFVNKRIIITDTGDSGSCFIGDNNRMLVRSADAGIRDDGRKKQRVCMTAFGAFNPADLEHKDLTGQEDAPAVVTVYG